MSKRREVQNRLSMLDEIDGIMVAMKNLALLEARKLETFLATQRRAVSGIEAAAQDFLNFYPQAAAHTGDMRQLLLVIGSERGFCGDFNETLLEPIALAMRREGTLLVAVGRRLAAKLQDDKRIAAFDETTSHSTDKTTSHSTRSANNTDQVAGYRLPKSVSRVAGYIEGPSVAEEVQATLVRLAKVLGGLQQRPEAAWRLSALYHDDESGEPRIRQLLPLAAPTGKPAYPRAPLLNLEPAQFLSQLTDQYFYAALHEVFYASLMAENRKRLEHMDSAIRRLEKDEAKLRLRYNALRQEEIIEEIEIIMLSAEALSD
ncbi:MAG: F0F1 ATP synthase subunit gamma [Nitrosomonadales bacterium]|nr:F0F1 ATP synthase subunit gamma [Nitrosomonadales bacterium]